MFKKILSYSPHIFALFFVLAFAAFAWTEPTVAPPGGNVSAPLNIGSTGQSKAGGLILNTGGATNGLIVDQGNVGIGTASPGEKLEVAGNIKAGAVIVSGVGQALQWLKNIGGTLHIQNQAGTSNVVVGQDGKVGIGTMSPQSILSFKMGSGAGQAQAMGKVYIATADVYVPYNIVTLLSSYTLPADSLNADGKAIRVTVWGEIPVGCPVNSNLALYFSGSQIAYYSNSWPISVVFQSLITRYSSTQTKIYTTMLTSATQANIDIGGGSSWVTTSPVDFSIDNNIIFNGYYGCGSVKIMGRGMMVEYLN